MDEPQVVLNGQVVKSVSSVVINGVRTIKFRAGKPPPPRETIALHEAGHAVAADFLGIAIKSATMGKVTINTRNPLPKLLAVFAAGQAATLENDGTDDGGDNDAIAMQRFSADVEPDERKEMVEQAKVDARMIVSKRWKAVRALAAELLKGQDIDGRTVARIINKAMPMPMVGPVNRLPKPRALNEFARS